MQVTRQVKLDFCETGVVWLVGGASTFNMFTVASTLGLTLAEHPVLLIKLVRPCVMCGKVK